MRRALLLLLSGCGVSFPSESKIEDLRILEIRTSPPEIPVFSEMRLDAELDDLAALPLNREPISLTAVVAHPDLDATFEIEWIRCRSGGGTGFRPIPCNADRKDRLGTGVPIDVKPIEIAFEDLGMIGGGTQDAITALASDPRDLFSGLRFYFNAQAKVASASIDVDTAVLEGTKRLLVFDPTIVALVLREARNRGTGALPTIAGFELPTLCTNVTDEEFAFILEYLRTRTPNRAPTYRAINFISTSSTVPVVYTSTVMVEVQPGEALRFRGRVPKEDKEQYRIIDDKCRLTEFTETMAWSWFTNVGDLSDQITSEGEAPDVNEYETTWRAPSADQLEEDRTNVRIWSVLRDGRGGSDSRVIDLVISKGG